MQRPNLSGPRQLLAILMFACGAYAFAGAALADVCFDPSKGEVIQTTIGGKHVASGRSTTYYLDLPAWGPVAGPSSVSVPRATYDALNAGDPVCMVTHPGALGFAWYAAETCQATAGA